MNWAEVRVSTTPEGIEILTGFLMAHGVNGVMIEDAGDFNRFLNDTTIHWDYVDEELMKMAECETAVKFYLPDNPQGFEMLNQIRADLLTLQADQEIDLGELQVTISYQEEEDWETAWKKYYRPIVVSDTLAVVPEWEKFDAREGQMVLRMDPGMAFGSGSHDTTRLCLTFLDQEKPVGLKVLDMGCGSGILSIGALLLGAESVTAVDIDQLATKIAHENAALNGCDDERLKVYCGNILADEALAEKIGEESYDLILANIVADVIIGLAPMVRQFLKPGGLFLCSGIIDTRADEVADALRHAGWTIEDTRSGEGWYSYTCR